VLDTDDESEQILTNVARCMTRFIIAQTGEGASAAWSDEEAAADANSDGVHSEHELCVLVNRLAPVFARSTSDVSVLVRDSRCVLSE